LYYRVKKTEPVAETRIGQYIDMTGSSWIKLTTDGQEISAIDGQYIEVLELDGNSKVTKWGKSEAVNDGFTPITGLKMTVKSTEPPLVGTVLLTVEGGDNTNKLYYQVVEKEPIERKEGDLVNVTTGSVFLTL
jgi:hypothetical protein